MRIEIISVGAPYMKGNYGKLDLEFVREGGQKAKQTLTAVRETKNVVNVLRDAKPGEVFDIKVEKSGDYFNWTEATKVADGEAREAKTSHKARTKWEGETAEERARRQVYIIKQSSLANAIALLGAGSDPKKVLPLAQQFTDWVLDTNPPQVAKERVRRSNKSADELPDDSSAVYDDGDDYDPE